MTDKPGTTAPSSVYSQTLVYEIMIFPPFYLLSRERESGRDRQVERCLLFAASLSKCLQLGELGLPKPGGWISVWTSHLSDRTQVTKPTPAASRVHVTRKLVRTAEPGLKSGTPLRDVGLPNGALTAAPSTYHKEHVFCGFVNGFV